MILSAVNLHYCDREVLQVGRRKIGLLLGQSEENYQKSFIEGFLKQIFTYDIDVCAFAMYNKYQKTTAREIGETTIFSLINYDMFDAFVVLLDTIQTPGAADNIEENLKKYFNGPVLCVDKESKYFSTIHTDSYSIVKKTISHLIEVHGYTDIAYLTGKKWHPHSQARLKAFIDCMEEHDLPIKENRIFYGDFWYSSGETMVEELLQSGGSMPRAIACANDCMTIGVAQSLVAKGFRIPEDVAIISYDSIEEGRTSPKPVTSAPIPAKSCGTHAAITIKSMLDNEPVPDFETDVELFIGSSCGCNFDNKTVEVKLREKWETDDSGESFFSRFNLMMEDLLSKSEFNDLMNTVFTYSYQIKGFESFTICLNSQWKNRETMHNSDIKWNAYTEQILPVLRCTNDNSVNPLNYDETFHKSLLIPDLHEERDVPKAFFFTPLHFEERCLGYAVISYGNKPVCYDDIYWFWLRNVMQGLECFRRIDALRQSNKILQASQTRDSLTGLYNYQGMLAQCESYFGHYVGALAVDIKGLSQINEKYGREEGNHAINTISHIMNNLMEDGMCCRLGNGEFVGAIISDDDKNFIYELKKLLLDKLKSADGFAYELSAYLGSEISEISGREDFERLINTAVSQKNGNKINERKTQNREELTEEEKKESTIVSDILDQNRFLYHFQPIVDARTGEIYSYEALMRADVTPFISPLKILKYAEYLHRLYDVERLTFFNVLDRVKDEKVFKEGKKVFINSIPGNRLHGIDAMTLENKIKTFSGSVVVELTEQAELPDDELTAMKELYAGMGIETAVDDYGTGYSNITNLLRYMPNYVKIDRMLLSKIQESPQKQHFVREIIEFAHNNDIKALAEGVETTEELQMVIHLGADLIQGYYTAKPSPEIIPEISKEIKEEIVKFHHQQVMSNDKKVYTAGKEGRIYLAKLVSEKYASINIVSGKTIYKDVTITGVPGLLTDITLNIESGYQGRIVLENVGFSSKKGASCITLGENCEVLLILKGENHLEGGGICVPEGSRLIFEGDGGLIINMNHDDFYAIGNDFKSGNGSIIFGQDGCIEINCSGDRGIGIGSGKGGEIVIKKGKYEIELIGEEGIGIGSYEGDVDLSISMCNMNLNMNSTVNVGIGSVYGSVNLSISHIMLKNISGGTESAGIGTLKGSRCLVNVKNSNLNLNMRSNKLVIIGQAEDESLIDMTEVGVTLKGEGKEAMSLGNFKGNGKIRFSNCDLRSIIRSNIASDIGAQKSDIHFYNGRVYFELNGSEIEREVEYGDL